ncbi:MAG: CvpA family protein [Pseudomonadota bacterium]
MGPVVDIVLLTLMGLCVIQGFAQGPLPVLKALGIWLFTLAFSLWLTPVLLSLLHWNDPHVVVFLIAQAILTLAFYTGFRVLFSAVLSGLTSSRQWSARLLGSLLGVGKAVLLVSYLLYFLSFTQWGQTTVFEGAQVGKCFQPGLRFVARQVDPFWRDNLLSWPNLLKNHPFIQRSYAPVVRQYLRGD